MFQDITACGPAEIVKRRAVKASFDTEAAEVRAAGDTARAYSKSTMTSRLTREMVREARELLPDARSASLERLHDTEARSPRGRDVRQGAPPPPQAPRKMCRCSSG